MTNSDEQKRRVIFDLEGGEFSRLVTGQTGFGDERVLLEEDDNLLAGLPWEKEGYTVATLFESTEEYAALVQHIEANVTRILGEIGIAAPDSFDLTRYHELVDDRTHGEVAKRAQGGFEVEALPFPATHLESRISAIVGRAVRCQYKKTDATRRFNLRVVRPKSNDNNPPHRDVWLDHLRNAINVYIPIAGSTDVSSLPIVPGSHHWKESEIERTLSGAEIEGQSYTVPSVTGAKRDVRFVRPNPGPNQVLVFTPYAIHGGGVNFQQSVTRVSLEARFWRA